MNSVAKSLGKLLIELNRASEGKEVEIVLTSQSSYTSSLNTNGISMQPVRGD
jgi:hypothetical protein